MSMPAQKPKAEHSRRQTTLQDLICGNQRNAVCMRWESVQLDGLEGEESFFKHTMQWWKTWR